MERKSVSSGTIWEERYGYSRAVRYGDRILVSGTTATGPAGQVVGPGDAAKQAGYIFDKIEKAIVDLGGTLADVVRTGVQFVDEADLDALSVDDRLERVAVDHAVDHADRDRCEVVTQRERRDLACVLPGDERIVSHLLLDGD